MRQGRQKQIHKPGACYPRLDIFGAVIPFTHTGFSSFRTRDWLLWGYNLYILLILWIAPHPFAHRIEWSLGHLLVLVLWPWLLPKLENRALTHPLVLLYKWLPLLMIPILYSEVTLLNETFFRADLDTVLLNWDTWLGANRFIQNLPQQRWIILDEFFHAAYFSYYLIFFVPLLIFYVRDEKDFEEYLTGLLFVSVVQYAFLIFLPADGPVELHAEIFQEGLLFIPLMNIIYRIGEYGGCAFPSEHVSTSVFLVLLLRERLSRQNRTLLFIWTGVVAFATIYCSYHYVVDVLAGLILGPVLYHAFRTGARKGNFLASS